MIRLHNIEENQVEPDKKYLFVQFRDTNINKKQYEFLKETIIKYEPDTGYGIKIDTPEMVYDEDSENLSVWIKTTVTRLKTHDDLRIAANKLTMEFMEEFPKFYEDLKQKAV